MPDRRILNNVIKGHYRPCRLFFAAPLACFQVNLPPFVVTDHSFLSMKPSQLAVFLTVALAVYTLINAYIIHHVSLALSSFTALRQAIVWLLILLASSYVAGRVLERTILSGMGRISTQIGSFWLGLMFYALLFVICIDLVRLVFWAFQLTPLLAKYYSNIKPVLFAISSFIIMLLALYGYYNATHPKVTRLDVDIAKTVKGRQSLHIVAATDIHMGTLVGKGRTRKLVEMINRLKPDLVLMGGDLVDEDLAPVVEKDLGSELLKLHAPMGVYACVGNHELIGGLGPALEYLNHHGVSMLVDSLVEKDGIVIAGRLDKDAVGFKGQKPLSVKALLENIDRSKPIILLNHQPYDLDNAAAAGVDFQLSGHTHHGQLWPLSYITKAIYEVSCGYLFKNGMHVFVSTGYGGWGPPMRIGNHPEIVDIYLHFTGHE